MSLLAAIRPWPSRDEMLPLNLLRAAQGHPVLVELKNGETYNGNLFNIDTWMNLNLREVIRTSKDGDAFWSTPELYIRGNTIKYLRVPDVIVDVLAEEKNAREASRGGRGGRGRGGGSHRGGRGGNRGGGGHRGGRGKGRG